MNHDHAALTAALEQMYGDIGLPDAEFDTIVDQSLNPRGPEMLYDKLAQLGVASGHRLLDIGCRDAGHALQIAQRFGCEVVAVDPVAHNLERANQRIRQANQAARVTAAHGRIEAIPAPDAHFDVIWCRDMLNHVPEVRVGLAECGRVLKPGGKLLIYQTFATDLLEPQERRGCMHRSW